MLRKRYVLAITVLLVLVILGAYQLAAAPISAATPGKGFVETVWAYEEAFRSGDVSQIIEFYAPDAISLPPGYPASEGREIIEADLTWFFDEFTLVERDFVLADYEVVGNYATRLGTWTQTLTHNPSGESFTEVGRCILGWNKIHGQWKVVWEIWNTY